MAGIDSYCKLMLHGDGDDGSQTIVDSETTPKTVTAVGNAQIDTAQKVFGTGSILFDGTGDALQLVDSSDWHFADGNFTIDGWFRWSTVATNKGLVGQFTEAGKYSWVVYFYSNTIRLAYSADGTNLSEAVSGAFTPTENTWYHIAVVRNGADLKIFIDGTQSGSTHNISTTSIFDAATFLEIGAYGTGAVNVFAGWIDEFRISKGVARWTANFTPPTEAYTTSTVYTLTITETCTMTDVKPLNSMVKTFTDSVTLTDVKPLKSVIKFLSDSIIITDMKPIKGLSKTFTDSVTLTELTLARTITKTFSDSVTLTDTVNRILSAFRTFSETVTLTEPKVTKEIQVSKIELVSLTEIVSKAITKSSFTESVTLLDTVSKVITLHPFVESCTLTDSNNKTIVKLAFVDSMTITERYEWWAKASEKSTVWSVTTAGTTVWIAVSTSTSPWSLST